MSTVITTLPLLATSQSDERDGSAAPRSDERRRSAARVRAALQQDIFAPARSRILWFPVHLGVIAAGFWQISTGLSWWLALAVSVGLGFSFAGLAFVAHEILHGAVVRGARSRHW